MDDIQNGLMRLRPDEYKLVPSSIWPTFICCVIHDGHPRDKQKFDIAVCLQGGTVRELFQREFVSSITLPNVDIKKMQILRNNKGDLFYLLRAHSEVIILLSTDQLLVYQRFSDVIHYEICDPECSVENKLMIKTESSTQYISFDDVKQVSRGINRSLENSEPVIPVLAKKLIEAKYNLNCHEKSYKKAEKFRQSASFVCHGDGVLGLKTSKPIIRFCNMKIVIQLEVENPYQESMNKVCVLIHNTSCNSISYTSKVYEHLCTSPFYREIEFRKIKPKCKASIVAVIPVSEFKSSISSRIDFSVIVSYEREKQTYLQSFDNVHISAGEVMGKNFDVFNNTEVDERGICIAMFSTTMKTILCLKQKGLDEMICLSSVFRKYLGMDIFGEKKMVAVHKQSPHHMLHGILIVFDDNENIDVVRNEINFNIEVYTRSSSQVMALIHFIHDSVPLSLVVTTPNIQVTLREGDVITPNTDDIPLVYNYTQCANSLLNQSSMTLEYLDNCLKAMSKHDMEKTEIQIDLFSMGPDEFVKYRNNMLAEAKNCLEHIVKSNSQTIDVEETMEID